MRFFFSFASYINTRWRHESTSKWKIWDQYSVIHSWALWTGQGTVWFCSGSLHLLEGSTCWKRPLTQGVPHVTASLQQSRRQGTVGRLLVLEMNLKEWNWTKSEGNWLENWYHSSHNNSVVSEKKACYNPIKKHSTYSAVIFLQAHPSMCKFVLLKCMDLNCLKLCASEWNHTF